MNWRHLSNAASGAIVITALSAALYRAGGELVLVPGLLAEILLNGLLLIFVPTGDDYVALPGGTGLILNSAFYTAVIFTLLQLLARIRERSDL